MDNYTSEQPPQSFAKSWLVSQLLRLRRQFAPHFAWVRLVLLLLIVGFLGILFLFLKEPLVATTSRLLFAPKMLGAFLFGSVSSLESSDSRTNILLLGKGGAGHEAPDLTDTILFISLGHKRKQPVFLSLPRDIWIPSLRAKLNTAYYYGNQKKTGGGLILARASVAEILDQPVHYVVTVDFAGFVQLIDFLGGVEVNVERLLDDYRYPIPGRENDECNDDSTLACRYEYIHFGVGTQVMGGERALKFVRSRNAEGEEGTDFARSTRQQKVLAAIKKEILSPDILLNPAKWKRLWELLLGSVETDIPQSKYPIFAREFALIKQEQIKNVVLDGGTPDSQNGFLINPPISPKYDNQWVLVPRDGTWREIRVWVTDLLR